MTNHLMLHTDEVTLGYGERTIISNLSTTIPPGKITSIIGANGCGKSTLLRSLPRLLPPLSGDIFLDDKPLAEYPRKQFATLLGLLPQNPVAPDGIVVSDLVGRGRHPYQGMFGRWTQRDYEVVAQALENTNTAELSDRAVDELSGGQRQRVWIAMALAQETNILLLDEPTTFLDIANQLEVLDVLVDLNQEHSTTIAMVLHDMNLAARYSDHLIAMRAGQIVASGLPAEVITKENMSEVFGISCEISPDPITGTPLVVPRGRH